MTKTTPRPTLDELLLSAPDDRGIVLRRYSSEMLGAKTLDDLRTETFAQTARQLGKGASAVREDFKLVTAHRRLRSKFSPEKLAAAEAREAEARRAHVAYSVGGRQARDCGLADDDGLQPTAALRTVELDQRRRDSATSEERAQILEERQAVKSEAERREHRARAASDALEEVLRLRDRIKQLAESDPDLFAGLPTTQGDTDDAL